MRDRQRSEQLYQALNDVGDEFLAEAEQPVPRSRSVPVRQIALAAACVCLVIGAASLMMQQSRAKNGDTVFPFFQAKHDAKEGVEPMEDVLPDDANTITGGETLSGPANENAADLTISASAPERYDGMIFDYDDSALVGEKSSVCYATPKAGSFFCHEPLKAALAEYAGQNVCFFVGMDIFSGDTPLEADSEEMEAELARLRTLGYRVGYAEPWEYQGKDEKISYRHAAGFFSAEQLTSFAAADDLGYCFHFLQNGDSSSVTPQLIEE